MNENTLVTIVVTSRDEFTVQPAVKVGSRGGIKKKACVYCQRKCWVVGGAEKIRSLSGLESLHLATQPLFVHERLVCISNDDVAEG